MHRPGIEPGPPAWQASILPLNQRCFLIIVIEKFSTIFAPFSTYYIKEILRFVMVNVLYPSLTFHKPRQDAKRD